MALARDASEKLFQDQVIQIARMNGWRVFHPAPMRGHDGTWRTPLMGDKGFVDLVLAHPQRGLIFAELKTIKGKVAPEQAQWLMAIQPHAEVYLWRPTDLEAIAKRLGASAR